MTELAVLAVDMDALAIRYVLAIPGREPEIGELSVGIDEGFSIDDSADTYDASAVTQHDPAAARFFSWRRHPPAILTAAALNLSRAGSRPFRVGLAELAGALDLPGALHLVVPLEATTPAAYRDSAVAAIERAVAAPCPRIRRHPRDTAGTLPAERISAPMIVTALLAEIAAPDPKGQTLRQADAFREAHQGQRFRFVHIGDTRTHVYDVGLGRTPDEDELPVQAIPQIQIGALSPADLAITHAAAQADWHDVPPVLAAASWHNVAGFPALEPHFDLEPPLTQFATALIRDLAIIQTGRGPADHVVFCGPGVDVFRDHLADQPTAWPLTERPAFSVVTGLAKIATAHWPGGFAGSSEAP